MTRVVAVRALLSASEPIGASISRLATFPWDSDFELVQLQRADIEHLLSLYRQGDVLAPEVEAWANAIEGRDDVGITDALTGELLHELANPLLTQPLSIGRADFLLDRLSNDR